MPSLTVDLSATDDHIPSKRRKVSFIEPISEPLGANVDEPDSTLKDQSLGEQVQSDIPIDEASSYNLENPTKMGKGHTHVSENTSYDATKSKKRPRTSTTDKSVQPVVEVLDSTTAPEIDHVEGSRSSKKLKLNHENSEDPAYPAINPTHHNQADSRTKGPEEPEHRTSYIGQADTSEVDVFPQPPMTIRKSRRRKSNASLSTLESTKGTSNSGVVGQQPAKSMLQVFLVFSCLSPYPQNRIQNRLHPLHHLKPVCSSLAFVLSNYKSDTQLDSKGKAKNSRQDRSLNTPIQPTLSKLIKYTIIPC